MFSIAFARIEAFFCHRIHFDYRHIIVAPERKFNFPGQLFFRRPHSLPPFWQGFSLQSLLYASRCFLLPSLHLPSYQYIKETVDQY